MKTGRQMMLWALLLAGVMAAVMPQGAMAAGTAACTSIANTATVDYQVGSVSQPQLSTGPSGTFVVGNKVNLTLVTTNMANVTVAPGGSGASAALTYTVTNNGNATQRYTLSTIAFANGTASPFSGNDNFNASAVEIWVDTGSGYNQTNAISSLASDATATVQIRANTIPLTQTNGDIAVYGLKAQTVNTDNSAVTTGTGDVFNAAGATVCTNVDIQLADIDSDGAGGNDGLRDGAYMDESAYQAQTVVLSVAKSSAVIDDGFSGTKAIPGATVEYTIRVTRTGGANSATGIVINDIAPNTTTLAGNVVAYGGNGEARRVVHSVTGGDTTTDLQGGAGDLSTWNTGTGQIVANCGAAFALDEDGDYCEIKFRVTIN